MKRIYSKPSIVVILIRSQLMNSTSSSSVYSEKGIGYGGVAEDNQTIEAESRGSHNQWDED